MCVPTTPNCPLPLVSPSVPSRNICPAVNVADAAVVNTVAVPADAVVLDGALDTLPNTNARNVSSASMVGVPAVVAP